MNESIASLIPSLQELPVFVQMVKDVFAVSVDLGHILSHPLCLDLPPLLVHTPKTPTASRRVMCGALEMGVVSQLVREEAVKAGLVPTVSWIKKTEQLLLMSQQKHGKQVCLCIQWSLKKYLL